MKKYLTVYFAILTLCMGVFSTYAGTKRVVQYGTLTFQAANTAAASGDTIEFATNDTALAKFTLRDSLTIRSQAGLKCTCFVLPTIADKIFTFGKREIFSNLVFRYTDAAPSGNNYILRSTDLGGHSFTNVDFHCGAALASGKHGIDFTKTSRTETNRVNLTNCRFDSLDFNFKTATDSTLADSIIINNCGFYNGRIAIGNSFVMMNSKMQKLLGENGLYGNNFDCHDNYFNGNNNTAQEFFSGDQTGRIWPLNNLRFYNNVFDSISHVQICLDAFNTASIYGNRFVNGTRSVLYHHSEFPADTSKNIRIENNVFQDGNGYNTIAFIAVTPSSKPSNINIRRNIFQKYGNILTDSVTADTITHCIWSNAANSLTITPAIAADSPYVSDTLRGKSVISYAIDTTKYYFLRRGGIGVYSTAADDSTTHCGARKYLLYPSVAGSITTDSFAVRCSLSVNYWFYDPVAKDSGKIYGDTSTDKLTWGKACSTGVSKVKAGWADSLRFTGLADTTKYYFRFRSDSLTTNGLKDTSALDSVITYKAEAAGFFDTTWYQSENILTGTVAPASEEDTCTHTFTAVATPAEHYSFATWTLKQSRMTVPAPTNPNFSGTFTDQEQSQSDTAEASFDCITPTLAHVPAAHICTTGVAVIPWTPTLTETDSIKGRLPAGLTRNATTGQVTGTPSGTISIVKTGYQDTAWGCDVAYNADTITVMDTAHWCVLTATAGTGGTITDPADGHDSALCNSGHAIEAAYTQGYRFGRWTRSSTAVTVTDSTDASTTATGSGAVVANFTPLTFTLTTAAGTGGSVTPAAGAHTVDTAAATAITATAGTYSVWDRWTRSGTAATITDSTDATTTVSLSANATVTANFTGMSPAAVTLASPDSADTATSLSVVFRWYRQAADSFYIFDLDTIDDFSTLLADTTTDTTITKTLADSSTYYWRVRGGNRTDTAASSETWIVMTQTASSNNNWLIGGAVGALGLGLGVWTLMRRKRN